MKSILPLYDVSSIKAILSHEDAYDIVAYDGSPSLKEYVPEGVWMLLLEEKAIAGFINAVSLNNIMWQAHIFVYPQFRGNEAEVWGKQAVEYMKQNYGAKKFLAITPYIAAKKFAERVGMQNVCILKDSILKNGEMMNQYVLEMGAEL